MKPKFISFFDLDHTLLSVNSSFCFGSYLYKNRVYSSFTMLYLVACYGMHKLGWISISQLHHFVFEKIFRGRSSARMHENANFFLDQYLQRIIYHPAFQRLQEAKKNGHFIVILSSSPDFLVGLIAERLGVVQWEASNYCLDEEQRFSHISRLIQGEEKANCVASYAQKYHVPRQRLIAYTDSHLDLPFLKSAGNCIGVNPDKRLRRICAKNQWEII